ncbi:MAG: hypothetical protein KAX81_02990 [Leadbetterella sp.]|uniref:hypothetical protein n=1 Tax=Lacihabitans sp. CCS-44 TaxID=2487331 RepID=UPI001B3EF2D2|nr:hypothetical protein [Lacihabitans sp. CCS-44]MBP6619558.1 hypothetical protein [Leadbetterella sp.]MBP8155965.1 hypothetical protein [Leadbetterella sp.]
MNRKVRKLPFDKHIVLALLILFVSDLLELSFFKEFEIKDKIQISLHLIIQFLFLIVFRKEGAILVQESKIDVLKIFIPAGLVFLIFGYFVFEETKVLNYILLVLYAILVVIILILSMYRPINNYSFYFGVFGTTLLFLYGLFYFLFSSENSIEQFYGISFGFYVFSQIFLIESFSTNLKPKYE